MSLIPALTLTGLQQMILTKEEFQKEFGYNSLPAVHRLIREKKIKTQTDGMINTEADENREFCLKRREKIQKKGTKKAPKSEEKPAAKNQKPEMQLNLELDILSQKYEQAQKNNRLLDVKIKKELGDTVSKDILNRAIVATFDELFKTLSELPNMYANEMINIINSSDVPRESLVEYLTDKIITELNAAVDNAKKAAKKYFEEKK